jgi:hypothetical protein
MEGEQKLGEGARELPLGAARMKKAAQMNKKTVTRPVGHLPDASH